ncbi:hypothetical protein AK812_SmicGene22816 [Symbiodinium microadriaticum]|uniref:Uncharacterized protein n=1 Tax=Symbiodinium microadriaticum TaxID=2951 RepID=A0A1Q9DIU3_SYMMI|nr:hypothetical protein AK812_SmicGene22816 [Symbiodinium microadriaticum]
MLPSQGWQAEQKKRDLLKETEEVWDTVIFFTCGAAGFVVDSLLYACNIWDGIQYSWMLMSFTGVIWCFHRSRWFGVAFCLGSSVSLLYRDLKRGGQDDCHDHLLEGSLTTAYWWSQALLLVLGPFVFWRMMVTSKALDRVYAPRPTIAWTTWAEFRDATRRWLHPMPRPSLTLTIHCEERSLQGPLSPGSQGTGGETKEPISLDFFQDLDVGAEESDMSEDEEQPLKPKPEQAERDRPEPHVGVLVHSRCGDYIDVPELYMECGQDPVSNTVTVNSDQYRAFRENSDPFLLFVFNKKVLLSADRFAQRRRQWCKTLLFFLVPACATLGMIAWSRNSSLVSVPVQYGSLVFLMLPDLIQVWMYNKTAATSSNASQHGSALNSTNYWTATGAVLKEGFECLNAKTTVGSIIAVWDSTFFYCGCMIFVFIGCYQLHAAANSLRELRSLLHLHDHNSPKLQAIILHRLHRIRTRIVHKQRLKYIGAHAFPDKLKPDLSLGWWFETRALIFSDINRAVSKRLLILMLCGIAEIVMVVLTGLAVLLDTGHDFDIMCYAAAFGVFLGLMVVLFAYLGNTVNVELGAGLQEIEATPTQEPASGGESPGSPFRSPSGRRVALKRGRMEQSPEATQWVNEFLDYERLHPRQLKFLGVPFSWQFATAYAAPLGTYAIGMIYWILQQTLTNTKHDA